MFKVVPEPGAWIDVKWPGLDDEGFEVEHEIRMNVTFLPTSEMQRLFVEQSEEPTVEFAKRVVRDWSHIRGPDEKPLPFTAENLEMVFDVVPGFARGFGVSYLEAYSGRGRLREKNSDASPADGQADGAEETKPRRSKSNSGQ